MPTFREEFPDFPVTDMPAMPPTFEDTSWHNNTMPSITSDALGLHIWIDYTDHSKRECTAGSPRFLVERQDHGVEIGDEYVLQTNEWSEVLTLLAGMKVGDKVEIIKLVENYPEVMIDPGPTGVITSIENDCYWVRLDKHVPALDEWQNRLQIWDWSDQDGPDFHPSTYLKKLEA